MRGKRLEARKHYMRELSAKEAATRCAWASCRQRLPAFPIESNGRCYCSFDCKEAEEEYQAMKAGRRS